MLHALGDDTLQVARANLLNKLLTVGFYVLRLEQPRTPAVSTTWANRHLRSISGGSRKSTPS